jgi:large subunit ribosomal protein L25
MATQVKLSAQRREGLGRSAVKKLKAAGIVPAIIYGSKDKPEPLQVSRREFAALLSHAAGENILVELAIDGEANRLAMVQEVQHAPIGGDVLHIDFHAVSMDEVIEADVPLEPTGTANGVRISADCWSRACARCRSSVCRVICLMSSPWTCSALNIGDGYHVRDYPAANGVTTRIPAD